MAKFQCPNCKTFVFANASRNCSHCGNQNIGHKLRLVVGEDKALKSDEMQYSSISPRRKTRWYIVT